MSCVLEHLTTLFKFTRPSQTSGLCGTVVTPEGLEGGADPRRDSVALGGLNYSGLRQIRAATR